MTKRENLEDQMGETFLIFAKCLLFERFRAQNRDHEEFGWPLSAKKYMCEAGRKLLYKSNALSKMCCPSKLHTHVVVKMKLYWEGCKNFSLSFSASAIFTHDGDDEARKNSAKLGPGQSKENSFQNDISILRQLLFIITKRLKVSKCTLATF